MPRPPLSLGSWGEVRTYVESTDDKGNPKSYKATVKYRDFDGVVRQVQRSGKTKSSAKNNLKIALTRRSSVTRQGELSLTSRFAGAAELWLGKFSVLVRDGERSIGSLQTYRKHLKNHVLPALAELRLGEVTTPVLDKVMAVIKRAAGAPTARSCRSVISGVLSLAVRYGAITANPVREVDRLTNKPKKSPRALTKEERTSLLAQLEADEIAVRKDLPDLTRFMLATGLRIGEALAVVWSEVDFAAGSVDITSTIIRVTGEGLLRTDTKNEAGKRTVLLPSWALAMLQRRFLANSSMNSPIFADSIGGFRDPSNTQRDFREARGTGEFAWLVSHSFRKTTATLIDDAGLTARKAADQLGHAKPSMTQDVYFGRKTVHPDVAAALEDVFDLQSEEKYE